MASDPSDWDPLPEVGAAQHPGEAATFGPPLPAAAAGASAAPLGALPAGGLLRGLQLDGRQAALPTVMQRSGSAGRTEPRQREPMQRSESRVPRIVARAPAPRPAPPVPPPAAPKAAPAQPPAPAMVLPAIEIDPREQEPWFRALPAAEQLRLQRAWASEQLTSSATPERRRQELLEWFWVAYVVFFVSALPLMLVEGLAGFVRMAMAGCVTGMAWQMVPRTRLWCVVSAVAVYFAIVVVPRIGELADSPFDLLVTLGGACIVGYLSSLALHEELHRRPAAA